MQKRRLRMKVRLITMFSRGIFWKRLGFGVATVVHVSNIFVKRMIRILQSLSFKNNE